MKLLTTVFLAILTLCCLGTSVFASDINFKAGLWKLTTNMEIPGMPHKMPGTTFTDCLTKDNLTPPVNEDGGCQIKNQQTTGNTTSYTMVCTQDGQTSTGQGSFTYDYDEMSGKVEIDHAGMKMITTYSGKWIGECK